MRFKAIIHMIKIKRTSTVSFHYHKWADVSVIIPTLNAEETILRAIHSVCMQTSKPREIIIVDGGSTDRTLQLIEKERSVEGWNMPIQLIKLSNVSPGHARNVAINKAESHYIAFLDADDEWHSKKMERSIEELKKHRCTLIAHDIIHHYPMGRKFYEECSKFYQPQPFSHFSLFLFDYITTSTVVVERQAVIKAGGFEEHFNCDVGYELWLKILKNPENSCFVHKGALTTYYIQPKSLSSKFLDRLACHEAYIARHARTITPLGIITAPLLALIRSLIIQNKVWNRALKNKAYHRVVITALRMPYACLKVMALSLIPCDLLTALKKRTHPSSRG